MLGALCQLLQPPLPTLAIHGARSNCAIDPGQAFSDLLTFIYKPVVITIKPQSQKLQRSIHTGWSCVLLLATATGFAMASDSFQALQHKIRADALEQQSALSSLQSWQAEIKAKDASLKTGAGKALPAPRNARPSTSASGPDQGNSSEPRATNTETKTGNSAADHTYDKGYKKWEKFTAVSVHSAAEGQDRGNANETLMICAFAGGRRPSFRYRAPCQQISVHINACFCC